MKKIIHLAMIAFIAISVVSCSKSDLNLQSDKKATVAAEAQNTGTSRFAPGINPVIYPAVSPIGIGEPSRIYRQINQPHSLELGSSKNSILHPGSSDYAVLYILVDRSYVDPSNSGTLTLTESDGGQHIRTYPLISSDEAATYDLQVPDEIAGKPYMFAMVSLDNLNDHAGKYISLRSEINLSANNTGSISAKLERAFIYIP